MTQKTSSSNNNIHDILYLFFSFVFIVVPAVVGFVVVNGSGDGCVCAKMSGVPLCSGRPTVSSLIAGKLLLQFPAVSACSHLEYLRI